MLKNKFIIIPIGGIGKRFKEKNFKNPKSLIPVNGKPIIFWLLDNLNISDDYTILIPYNNKEYSDFNFEDRIKNNYPDYKFIFFPLLNKTRGAVETIKISISKMFEKLNIYEKSNENDKYLEYPVICIDSDNFYLEDILDKWNGENKIFVFKDTNKNPIFSYIKEDENNNIIEIIEKEKISDLACCGAYGFSSILSLYKYCNNIIENETYQKDEFYLSGLIDMMIKANINFKVSTIKNKNYFTLGTPENLEKIESVFLLDLDGTLVSSDDIYIKVWEKILIKYNLKANDSFFNYFIKGKSDEQVLKYIFPEIDNDLINKISFEKDRLFTNYVSDKILFNGIDNFFQKIKNSYIAVVTSSNRKSAETVLIKTGINNYINLLIASEDCINHKPNPEPYHNALKKFGLNFKNIIIFEDSHSGYLSAKQITNDIYIKLSDDNSSFEATKFNQYDEISDPYQKLNKENKPPFNDIRNYLPIKKILKSSRNLKTGYICNIDLYELIYYDDSKTSVILKLNNDGNVLSDTAKKLNMYEKEVKFYRDISNIINVKVPKCYFTIYSDKEKGMLLENLFTYKGKIDCNLNKDIKNLMTVIKELCNMHLRFKFENHNQVIAPMSSLKKVNQIKHYYKLIESRYLIFKQKIKYLLKPESLTIFDKIKDNLKYIGNELSSYPLNFCHGDYKSPNIFYKDDGDIIILDWQYIHLGKGVSDLVFLLVESIDFDIKLCNSIKYLYYKQYSKDNTSYSIEQFDYEFNLSLCMFPFFVCVWFNSENLDKLIDSTFPLRFIRNLEKYYNYYLKDFKFQKNI